MKLIELRKAKGWSMETLAAKADVSIATIRRIERGTVVPRPSIVRRLCKALGVKQIDLN